MKATKSSPSAQTLRHDIAGFVHENREAHDISWVAARISPVFRSTLLDSLTFTRAGRGRDSKLHSGRRQPMVSASVTSLPDATTLAVERTRLAHERTLMAWGRTATSLISFGFTIYKFFQYLRETGETPVRETLIEPRGFALIMIAIGLTALTLATIEHRRSMRALRNHYGELVPMSLATLTAGLIATLGVLMLLAVALRQ